MRIIGIAALLALSMTGAPAMAAETQNTYNTSESFVRLGSWGLSAGQPGLHAYTSFDFGISRAEATRQVSDLLGRVSQTGVSRACGARPLAFARFRTLTLYFRNDRFVGWALAGPRQLHFIESEWQIGIGSTRSDLAQQDNPAFRRTARGTEFDADGMHGLLSGPGARGRVTAMWAGTTCRGR